MKEASVLIICKSIHHNNTMKICNEIADVMDAAVVTPYATTSDLIADYDLIGFGSGIYDGAHHQSILDLIKSLEDQSGKPAFVFSTCTIPVKQFHKEIDELLVDKGFKIIGEFQCKGFINYGFTKRIFGGFNKQHPNQGDLDNARKFAKGLSDRY